MSEINETNKIKLYAVNKNIPGISRFVDRDKIGRFFLGRDISEWIVMFWDGCDYKIINIEHRKAEKIQRRVDFVLNGGRGMTYNIIKNGRLEGIVKNKLELYKYFDMIYSVLKTKDDFERSSGFLVQSKSKDIWTVEASNKKPVKYWRPEFDKLKMKEKNK